MIVILILQVHEKYWSIKKSQWRLFSFYHAYIFFRTGQALFFFLDTKCSSILYGLLHVIDYSFSLKSSNHKNSDYKDSLMMEANIGLRAIWLRAGRPRARGINLKLDTGSEA